MVARQGNVIIMGDFNYPDTDWADGTNGKSSKACHFLQDNFMCQLVDTPTRNKALLDLLITNNAELFADMEVRVFNDGGKSNLGNHNHRVIMFTVNHKKRRHKGRIRTLNFNRANFTKLHFILHNIKWAAILDTNTTGKVGVL